MARIDPLERQDMNDEQGRAYDQVAARGGHLNGPNAIYLRVPELFGYYQQLSNYLRDNTISLRLRQIAAMVAVRRWNGAYAWGAQARDALKAGISRDIIDAINARDTPDLTDADDSAVYYAALELADTGSLSDTAFDRAITQLGFNRLLDVVATVGFYTAASLNVNVFEIEPFAEFPVSLAP